MRSLIAVVNEALGISNDVKKIANDIIENTIRLLKDKNYNTENWGISIIYGSIYLDTPLISICQIMNGEENFSQAIKTMDHIDEFDPDAKPVSIYWTITVNDIKNIKECISKIESQFKFTLYHEVHHFYQYCKRGGSSLSKKDMLRYTTSAQFIQNTSKDFSSAQKKYGDAAMPLYIYHYLTYKLFDVEMEADIIKYSEYITHIIHENIKNNKNTEDFEENIRLIADREFDKMLDRQNKTWKSLEMSIEHQHQYNPEIFDRINIKYTKYIKMFEQVRKKNLKFKAKVVTNVINALAK